MASKANFIELMPLLVWGTIMLYFMQDIRNIILMLSYGFRNL